MKKWWLWIWLFRYIKNKCYLIFCFIQQEIFLPGFPRTIEIKKRKELVGPFIFCHFEVSDLRPRLHDGAHLFMYVYPLIDRQQDLKTTRSAKQFCSFPSLPMIRFCSGAVVPQWYTWWQSMSDIKYDFSFAFRAEYYSSFDWTPRNMRCIFYQMDHTCWATNRLKMWWSLSVILNYNWLCPSVCVSVCHVIILVGCFTI